MFNLSLKISFVIVLAALALASISCSASAKNEVYFGKTVPPARNVLHYYTGDEPESLDPQVSTGQPEGRIYMALFEGLVEYDPKDMHPIPAIAERWDINNDFSEFVFHLRKNARWSNGDGINANDFVYTFRRGLSPKLASRNAGFGYYLRYGEAYNQGAVFVQDGPNHFLLEKDFAPEGNTSQPLSQKSLAPAKLTLPGDEKTRNKLLAKDPKLKAAVAGKELVDVKSEDIGVEAVDPYTLRLSLRQSAPFFLGLLANQFFRLVPGNAVKVYGDQWATLGKIVTCGPFKLKSWKPYNELIVERDPMYWDAANVHLDEIDFYPLTDLPTAMNLYKVGELDAVANHSVPNPWVETVREKKDYMIAPEAASIYIHINITKPPMNDVRVRKAFNLAIDKDNWIKWRKIVKPLDGIVPQGIFKEYPYPKGDKFDPEKARALLAQAGYPVTRNSDGSYACPTFPVDQVEYTFPTASTNKTMAEFMQAQWKQSLGITVSLRSMEFKTFISYRANLEYKGMAFGAFSADYMDPYTFSSIFYTPAGDNGTGWWDQKYVDMLDEANTLSAPGRFELLARAEQLMIDAQPIIPIETSAVNWTKKPYVKGLYPNAGSLFPWKFVYIERDPSKWDYGTPSLTE
jgi:oligopeptide transport system substrate-binding protein